jgi:NTE family protein
LPSSDRRVALVIGSGSVKCAAAIGVWKVLAREGIAVDIAVGCSGGSIYAAAIALGFDVAESERRTLVMWRDLFTRFHYRSLLRAVFPRLLRFDERVGLIDDARVRAVLHEIYGDATFADARVPLFITATDFATGEKVVLAEGRVVDAVRASIALPLLLRPWPVGGRLLIDGGASNPLPVDVGIREGCEIILALGFENHPSGPVSTFAGAVGRTTTIVQNHLLRATFAFYSMAHHAEVMPVIPTFDHKIGLTDASEVPYIIEEGARAMEEQLPYLRRLLAAPPSAGGGEP